MSKTSPKLVQSYAVHSPPASAAAEKLPYSSMPLMIFPSAGMPSMIPDTLLPVSARLPPCACM
eukprot:17435-Rhodomonas_salina.2